MQDRFLSELESKHLQIQASKAETLFNLRGRLETELNARLHLTHGLAGFVRAGIHSIDRESFQSFAQDLGVSLTGIRSLQLAPEAVVTYLWPEESNQKALGHDLMADPERRKAAKAAIEARRLWVAGPLDLIQGGTALIGRHPVFVREPGATSAENSEKFWGFATVLVDLHVLLEVSGFSSETERSVLAIRGRNGLGAEGDVFYGPDSVFDGPHLTAEVALPAGSWQVAIDIPPAPGLSDIPLRQQLLAVTLTTVIASLVYMLLRLPYRYTRAVDHARMELERSNAQFKDAIESLPDGFAVFDADDKLVRCNHKYRDFFETGSMTIPMGISFPDLIRESLKNGVYSLDNDTEEGQEAFLSSRLDHHQNPSDECIELQLASGRWLRTQESRVPSGGTVISYSDISELKTKEFELAAEKRRAESANEAKTAFLATVSHELRTPMNAILGLLNLIKVSGRLTPKDQQYINTTHESAEHLLTLLNELLDLSKMEANRLELEFGDFNLAEVVRKTLKLSNAKALQKRLELIEDIGEDVSVIVNGDAGRLQQILLNLLSNGIKFTDKGSITLAVHQAGSDNGRQLFRFVVTDTGVGFDDAQADKLFLPFSQLDSTAARKHEGTGLGLAICRRLIEKMGGSIRAHARPGSGAQFEFELPLEIRAKETQLPEESSDSVATPAEMGHPPIRVLLAEDSLANQIVFRAMLEGTGYVVDVAGNGLEALELAKTMDYDLILMDIFMPEMDGLQAARLIRGESRFKDKPIVALTANAMPGDQAKFLEAGMDDYIAKPVVKANLIRTLNKWALPSVKG
ncbi:response regulator [Marinobacter salinisoli]|uniref:histidine kinase n=1 Tax=Marinobacter salinisoli TaxID=2769486 RepID=A0ABX7MNX3_9GAMM|nr:ATP-binding protein [Marinobacter salinisoli]QSP93982.1 response regulator [Marinobacter salinisoli]